MTTNNEILMKHKSIADDYTYKYKREDIFDMLNEAQAETAKQIFKELDGSNVDNDVNLYVGEDTYLELKKEYNIEE